MTLRFYNGAISNRILSKIGGNIWLLINFAADKRSFLTKILQKFDEI